ncbi:hypothetical protein EYF80_039761 [Liparis tanakae]|uniref:Uncharacterized protein n=1 Tax=Liparis tanakae TaxID=230148 RepID=A0A4Z2G9Y6_9TELE|nr:hypothetical protein EYF80_039761 [Liparis tanakae]
MQDDYFLQGDFETQPTSFSWSSSCRTASYSISRSSYCCLSCCFSSSTASPYSAAWIFSFVVSLSSRERRSISARTHSGAAFSDRIAPG